MELKDDWYEDLSFKGEIVSEYELWNIFKMIVMALFVGKIACVFSICSVYKKKTRHGSDAMSCPIYKINHF